MSDKSDLKAELERKKQRLAQIREEKKRKEEERKKKEVKKTKQYHDRSPLSGGLGVKCVCFCSCPVSWAVFPDGVMLTNFVCVHAEQADNQQKTEVTPEDSDLDRKRRETEALLQSIGISPEPPLGKWITRSS